MKKLILFVMFMATVSCASKKEHKAMHVFVSGTEDSGIACTAYAIGPHAIETAEHCLRPDLPYAIDKQGITVKETLLDHKDHAILILSKTKFKDFVVLKFKNSKLGGRVYSYTNQVAVGLFNQYDEGYRSGSYEDQMVFFLPVISGSSGAIIFNLDGSVAGIVSQASGPYAISNRLEFTAGDLAKAAAK